MACDPVTMLAFVAYFESRSEGLTGMLYTVDTVLNRVESKRFPDNICDVVTQKNQYSFYWDGLPEIPRDQNSWMTAEFIARWMLKSRKHYIKSCHYHATYVHPSWDQKYKLELTYKNHIFFEGGC